MVVHFRLVVAMLLACVASQAAAQITLYEHENYRGRSFSARGAEANLKEVHFNDVASAIVIEGGSWEVCTDANFRGRCEILERTHLASLRDYQMNDQISSVRPVSRHGKPPHRGSGYAGGDAYRQRSGERLYEVPIIAVYEVHQQGRTHCWAEGGRHAAGNRRGERGDTAGMVVGHRAGGVRPARDSRKGAVAPLHDARPGAGRGYEANLAPCRGGGMGQPVFWDVGYEYRGAEHWVRLRFPPGRTVQVNRDGEPRF